MTNRRVSKRRARRPPREVIHVTRNTAPAEPEGDVSRETGPAEPPVPIARGAYSLYELPNGDGLLAYRPEHLEEDLHQVIPAPAWNFIQRAMRGEKIDLNPMQLLQAMMGGRRG
jgi:hypothetical protein